MSERLYTIGVDELLRSIGDASAYFAKGGELVCAKGLVKALNYKRVHRLQIAGVQSEIEPE